MAGWRGLFAWGSARASAKSPAEARDAGEMGTVHSVALILPSHSGAAAAGGLKARVEQIGADSIATEKGEIYYLIRVRTDETFLKYGSEELPIIPGMVADVDILTGKKTVLSYLTKPLTRMRDVAMRER